MTRILLVEDERLIARDGKDILETLGYEVVDIPWTGEDAIDKALSLKPDLILMDIRLKGELNGIDAARIILERFSVPIIFCTGHTDDATLQRAREVQPYGYLTKPFEPVSFQSTIETALYKFEMDTKLRESEEKFRAVIYAALNAILMMDSDGNIVLWNKAAQEMFGYTAGEAKGRNFHTLLAQNKFRDTHEKAFLAFLKTGKGNAAGKILKLEAVRKNGRTFPIELSLSSIQLRGAWNAVGFIKDITEQKHFEDENKKRLALVESAYNISKKISRKLKYEDVLFEIVNSLHKTLHYYGVMLFMPDDEGKKLNMQAIAGGFVNVFPADLSLVMGEGMIGQAAQTGKAQMCADVTLDPNYVCKAGEVTKSELALPVKKGRNLLGVLDLQSDKLSDFEQFDVLLLKSIVGQIAVAIDNARLYNEAKTDLKKLKETKKGLQRAQAELAQILNTTAEGIRVIDKELNITKVNRTFLKMVGMKEKDVTGKKCHQILYCSLCHTLNCPIFSITKKVVRKEHDLKMRTPGGQKFDTLLHISPFKNNEGKLIGIVESIRNVTANKNLEAQLQQAQKLESIGQLAAGIAHEINTPTQYVGDNTRFLKDSFDDILNLFLKYQQLLQVAKSKKVNNELIDELEQTIEETDIPYLLEEVPKAIEQSIEGIARITNIVQAMKKFSHPGSKEKFISDINNAIETTVTVTRNEWKYVAEMELDFAKNLPLVPCYVDEFNQVVLNLITNAAYAVGKALEEGANDKGIIKISTHHIDNFAEIRISDTGTGIPEDVQGKIFDPFFTTKGVGKGTGQGLAISYDVIVNKHGGTLTFETEEGKGTTFIIRLPL